MFSITSSFINSTHFYQSSTILLLNVSNIKINLWISTVFFLHTVLTNSRDDFKTLPQNPVPSLGFHLPQIIICNRESTAASAFSLNFYTLSQTWQRGSLSMTTNLGRTLDSPGKLWKPLCFWAVSQISHIRKYERGTQASEFVHFQNPGQDGV